MVAGSLIRKMPASGAGLACQGLRSPSWWRARSASRTMRPRTGLHPSRRRFAASQD